MGKQTEALKLALEALEHIQRCIGFGTATIHFDSATWHQSDAAITAIRKALAEQPAQQQVPERMKPFVQRHHITSAEFTAFHVGFCCGEEFNKQPAQKQEPVGAVTVSHYKGLENHDFDYWGSLPDGTHNLYTSPPASKPWVGLTEEEIDAVDEANWDEDHKAWGIREFARAIEAKLREKNA